MKILLSWLRDYVDVPYSVDELADRLPMLGLGIDGVERLGEDGVFDLELAANRGDLMSLLGVAREIAAASRGTVVPPATVAASPGVAAADDVRVEVLDADLCPRYTATLIVDVRVGPSPPWMAHRLEASGVRSINNVVDVTNYVMLELGQPMHAFDYDRLAEHAIVVRRARDGERLVTLDGIERTLDPQTLLIADAARAVGVGGVIGGAESEIGSATTRVLLEAAAFAPASIRRTSKRLGVRTESSARFERGVDTAGIPQAAARAAAMIVEVAGGRVAGRLDAYPAPVHPRSVDLRWRSIARLLGVEIPIEEGEAILRSLGFTVARIDAMLRVGVPSFRRDVEREEDLVEEVARHYGYDKIPESLPVEMTAVGTRVPVLVAEEAARSALIRAGLTEVLSVSLTRPDSLDALRLPAEHPSRQAVRLLNPLVEDHTQMRTTLLPGLLEIARTNVNRRIADVQIFEIGRVFRQDDGRVGEPRRVGFLMTGRVADGTWNLPAESVSVSFYHLKGVIESLLVELHVEQGAFDVGAAAPWLHPGRAALLRVAGDPIGMFGELHPEIAAAFDLPAATFVAELDLDRLLAAANLRPQYRPLPRFPAVRRDLAVIVPQGVAANDVLATISSAGGDWLERAELFDAYVGEQIPAGGRSLAYALTFRAPDRTLSAAEVDAVLADIKRALTHTLQAQIRE